jgi:anti-anti-sigma regulatory factor
MPYQIQKTELGLVLELKGGVTVRHAAELGKSLASALTSGISVEVRTQELEDVDTSVLQMLVSLRKTAGAFVLQDPSKAFLDAAERCALRRELVGPSKESL